MNNTNYIEFNLSGAIDYTESVRIEISTIETEGFIEIDTHEFFKKVCLPHIYRIVKYEFYRITKRTPPIFKIRSIPIYIKCYKYFHHYHQGLVNGKSDITILTIDQAIDYIIKEQLDILWTPV